MLEQILWQIYIISLVYQNQIKSNRKKFYTRYILRHTTMAYNSMRNILKSTNKAIIADYYAEPPPFFCIKHLLPNYRILSKTVSLLESNNNINYLYINNIAIKIVRRIFLDFYLVSIFLCYYFAT